MPIYEYQCQACEAVVEELQKISDAPLKKCPECNKNKLVKLVSAPSFRLSGTGWYETDFKSEGDKKRNLTSDDSKGESKKADDSKASKGEGKSKADPSAGKKKSEPKKSKGSTKKTTKGKSK